jgi:hypothetical protein
MDYIHLDQLPAPRGSKKGRYKYVRSYPAPVWAADKLDRWLSLTRAGMVFGALAALAALAKALSLI